MNLTILDSGIISLLGKERGFAAIAEAGFTGVDWNICRVLGSSKITSLEYKETILAQTPEEIYAYFSEELSLIRKNGLALSQAHGPFPVWVPEHPEVLDDMIAILCNCIFLCEMAGCPYLVIHGISHEKDDMEHTPTDIDALNRKLCRGLLPALSQCPHVTVCLENLKTGAAPVLEGFCSNPHYAASLVDDLNREAGREAFGLCLDTGHLILMRRDFRYWISVVGSRLKTLHLNDNDGQADKHQIPTQGRIRWNHVCDTLRQIGYKGDVGMEVFTRNILKANITEQMLLAQMRFTVTIGKVFRARIAGEDIQ